MTQASKKVGTIRYGFETLKNKLIDVAQKFGKTKEQASKDITVINRLHKEDDLECSTFEENIGLFFQQNTIRINKSTREVNTKYFHVKKKSQRDNWHRWKKRKI